MNSKQPKTTDSTRQIVQRLSKNANNSFNQVHFNSSHGAKNALTTKSKNEIPNSKVQQVNVGQTTNQSDKNHFDVGQNSKKNLTSKLKRGTSSKSFNHSNSKQLKLPENGQISPKTSTKIKSSRNFQDIYSARERAKNALRTKSMLEGRVVINLKRCIYPVLTAVAMSLGMVIVRDDDKDWDVCWSDFSISTIISKKMSLHHRVNHFPGMANLESKAILAYHLNRMKYFFPDEYNIFPKSWSLPRQWKEVISYNREHTDETLILKPTRGAEGKGIKILNFIPEHEVMDQDASCQVYLSNVLLINGFKFDLRVYVLMTSMEPLRILVYNNGLVRLATCPYSKPNPNNLNNKFMHLTNFSINKESENYNESPENGSKRDFIWLNSWLLNNGMNGKKLWDDIDDVIVKTIISVYPWVKEKYKELFSQHYEQRVNACFEIFGFDIIIDDMMKPYLLEVNRSPSFSISGEVDTRVKKNLISDTFKIVNLNQDKLDDGPQKSRYNNKSKRDQNNPFAEVRQKGKIMTIKQQIQWEEKYHGDYRLVYPKKNANPCTYRKYIHKVCAL